MTRTIFVFLFPFFVLPLLAACGDDDGSAGASGDKIQVITTLPLFADFVRNIGGDRVEVTSLIPNGADPHTFEPSPRDVERIADADIAFATGLVDESTKMLLAANLRDDAELVEFSQEDLPVARGPGGTTLIVVSDADAHLWMNVEVAKGYASVISKRLDGLDPTDVYTANYSRYAASLDDLRNYMLETVDPIPVEKRKLVTTHFAFEWFAVTLGFGNVAVVANSPGQEPSPQDIARLRESIERENVPAVFVEPQIDEESDILRQAADDAGVEVCTLYSDSLDDEVSTYIEMMRFNADELARCLGGDSGD